MGSTCFDWLSSSFSWDHPHIHGEHMISIRVNHGKEGSPPYTWGALSGPNGVDRELGITPIYMGSTDCPSQRIGRSRDHPHIHGEHNSVVFVHSRSVGSPPYTWGAPHRVSAGGHVAGITPIYMGSTHARPSPAHSAGDHPHIHGEHPLH